MKRYMSSTIVALMLSQQAMAQHLPTPEERATFRDAVADYQLAVVPRCAPDAVHAYVTAMAERDRAFVRSLRNTELQADYKQAVADHAKRERSAVFHCFGAPPPPPPPPGASPIVPAPVEKGPDEHEKLVEHFADGDRLFDKMAQLRDAALASSKR